MIARSAFGAVALLLLPMPALGSEGNLGIAEVIRAVHSELIRSHEMRVRDGVEELFKTKQFELELSFVVSSSVGAAGGIKLEVIGLGGFNIGGTGDIKQEQIQKIKLVFETVDGPTTPGILPAPPPQRLPPQQRWPRQPAMPAR